MAVPAASQERSASDPRAIVAAAYPQARRIAFSRWLGKVDETEIESLVGAAVVKLLDGEAEVIDVPRTVKYLTNFVDWRASDHLRAQDRRDEAPLPDDEAEASGSLQEALTASDPSPEEAIDSAHTRQILVELKRGIPSRVDRLIVHLAFSEERTCPQIARSVSRVLGEQLTPKAVEMRKYQALKALTVEWGRVLKGEHCRKFATAAGADEDALSRYALDLFDRDDTEDLRLRALVAAHLEHCALCRAAVAERRRDLRRAGLLAVPILVGAHAEGNHPAEQALAHAPGVFERALESVRSGLGRGTVRAAEVAPNGGSNAGEMIGSASAGGGVAVGGSLVTKLVVVGTAAVCAVGGQQICAHLFATQPAVRHHHHRGVRQHRHHHKRKTTASLTPTVPAAPRKPPAASAGQLAQPGAKTIQHDQQQTQASAPAPSPPPARSSSAGASSSSTAGSSDPTFNQAAPTHSSSSPSPSSSGGGGSSSGGGGSSGGDSTFENLP